MERSNVRIAVVGTGIAGLATAWLLSRRHPVTVFEADARVGGHSHTVTVATADGAGPGRHRVHGLQRAHLPAADATVRPSRRADRDHDHVVLGQHRRRLAGIWRRLAAKRSWPSAPICCGPPSCACCWTSCASTGPGLRYLEQPAEDDLTLGDFLARHGFGRSLGEWYLLPMAAAIWSAPVARMLDYPARSFLSFFANHGLLSIQGHHAWRTVTGGSRAICPADGGRVRAADPDRHADPSGPPLARGRRGDGRLGRASRFDHVVLACHADQMPCGCSRTRRRASARSWALSATSPIVPSCTATPP